MKRVAFFLMLSSSLALSVAAQQPERVRGHEQSRQDRQDRLVRPSEEDAKLRFAASTHEIIMAELAGRNFEAVLPEFRKILALEFNEDLEGLLVEATWGVVDALREERQFRLAHQILDETLEKVVARESQFNLLILKGKTYKDEGKLARALEAYRRAQALSKG